MNLRFTVLAISCIAATAAFGQEVTLTPTMSLNQNRVHVQVPSKFASSLDTARFYLDLPPGYAARVFYAGGLQKPRFITFDPNGTLYVSDMGSGKIYAMPDANNDGVADTAMVVATGFNNNNDVKFYKGNMYVTETVGVIKLSDNDKDGFFETGVEFIKGIPKGGNHTTRTLVFDSINHKAYLSVGSSCNVCRETDRAIIMQFNDDGTNGRMYAYGVRNAVGMTLHPVTGRLWANNNGSDYQGDEIPPEWTDLVRDGGFYGHPLAYGSGDWFNFNTGGEYQALKPITAVDSANVDKMLPPAALIRAHSAPMAIQFLNSSFPAQFRNGFLMALHGSWNTPKNYRGYKVIYLDLSSSSDTTVNYVADFVSGFLNDTAKRSIWGRPVGLAVNNSGQIFMTSDDSNKFVMMIYPTDTGSGFIDAPELMGLSAYPNPFASSFNISFTLTHASDVEIRVWDVTGKLIRSIDKGTMSSGNQKVNVPTENLQNGIFFYEVKAGNKSYHGKLIHVK